MAESSRDSRDASVLTLIDLLDRIVANPSEFIDAIELCNSLESQSELARYVDTSSGLVPMSLNTQKKVAERILSGFQEIDVKRRAAKDAIASERFRARQGSKRTKAGLLIRVREQEQELQVILEDLQLLQRAFERRCTQARNYVETSNIPSLIALCRCEQNEIDAGLELRRKKLTPSNVTPLTRYERP